MKNEEQPILYVVGIATVLLVLISLLSLTGCAVKQSPVAAPPMQQSSVAPPPTLDQVAAPVSEPVALSVEVEPQDPDVVKALAEYEKTKKFKDIPKPTGKKLVYDPNRQYVLTCPEWGVLTIRLLPGEMLLRTLSGNTAEWMIDDTVMEVNGEETALIGVRRAPWTNPTEVTFVTDRNLYDFRFVPGQRKRGEILRRYEFYDPIAEMRRKNGEVRAAQERKKKQNASRYPRLAFDHMRTYQVHGDQVSWAPVKVMGDHERTLIEMPSGTGAQQPTLTVIEDGVEVRPNVRTSTGSNGNGPVLIVDQPFREGRLYGEGGIVTISQGGEQ